MVPLVRKVRKGRKARPELCSQLCTRISAAAANDSRNVGYSAFVRASDDNHAHVSTECALSMVRRLLTADGAISV